MNKGLNPIRTNAGFERDCVDAPSDGRIYDTMRIRLSENNFKNYSIAAEISMKIDKKKI